MPSEAAMNLLYQVPLVGIFCIVVFVMLKLFLTHIDKQASGFQAFIKEQREANNLAIKDLAAVNAVAVKDLAGANAASVKELAAANAASVKDLASEHKESLNRITDSLSADLKHIVTSLNEMIIQNVGHAVYTREAWEGQFGSEAMTKAEKAAAIAMIQATKK